MRMMIPKNRDNSGTDVPYIVWGGLVGLTPAFQPRRPMMAPAAVGCKRLLDGMAEAS